MLLLTHMANSVAITKFYNISVSLAINLPKHLYVVFRVIVEVQSCAVRMRTMTTS